MEAEGSLIDLNKGMKGRGKKHRYQPSDEICIQGPEFCVEEPLKIDLPEPVLDALVEDVTNKIHELNKEIVKGRT